MIEYLIIGGGPASYFAIKAIRDQDPTGQIILISDEPTPLYYRAALTRALTQELKFQELNMASGQGMAKLDFKTVHDMARTIDLDNNKVITLTGYKIHFDKLLLATGSTAKMPNISERHLRGVFTLRSLRGALDIGGRLGRQTTALIVGGGVLGMDAAKAVMSTGAKTTLLVRENHVGKPMLDATSARVVENAINDSDVDLILGDEAEEIIGDGDQVLEVHTKKKKNIPCEVCIFCIGTAPNIELVRKTDIELGKGILVDPEMKTNIKNVYAAGDVCEAIDFFSGKRFLTRHWATAAMQGWVAGKNMAGEQVAYSDICKGFSNSGMFFDIPYQALGDYQGIKDGSKVEEINPDEKRFRRIITNDGKITGALLLGQSNICELADLGRK